MALNRFDTPSPVHHTGSFFELPYEILREPLLSMDQRYEQTQAGIDTYFQDHANQDYLQGDIEFSAKRREELLEQEAKLREDVGGDLLNPRYQKGIRDMVRKEATNPFYKKAAFNYKVYTDHHLKSESEYYKQHGTLPSQWQDPSGQFFRNYTNANQMGTINYRPIEARIPFTPLALQSLEGIIKNKLHDGSGTLQAREGKRPDGSKYHYLVSRNRQRLTHGDLMDMLSSNPDIMASRAYTQLQDEFNEEPRLHNAYSNFDDYFMNEVLPGIASQLEYDFSEDKFMSWIPEKKQTQLNYSPSRKRRNAYRKGKEAYETMNKQSVKLAGAQDPVGVPTLDVANDIVNMHMEARDELLNGTTEIEEGGTVYVPPMRDKILNAMGIEKDNDMGIKMEVTRRGNSSELQAMFTYINDDGKEVTIDMFKQGPAFRDEIAKFTNVDFDTYYQQIGEMNRQYDNHTYAIELAERFKNGAGQTAFGASDWAKVQEGKWESLMSEPQRLAALRKERIARSLQNFNPELQEWNVAVRSLKEDDLDFVISELSLDKEIAQIEDVAIKRAAVREQLKARHEAGQEIPESFFDNAKNEAYRQWMQENDTRYKQYEQIYTDRWEKGLTQDYGALHPDGVTTGVTQTKKKIWNINLAADEAKGDRYTKNLQSFYDKFVTRERSGGVFQDDTHSKFTFFNFDTNEHIDDSEYRGLAMTDDDGKAIGFDLAAIVQDDNGFNIIVTGKKGAAEGKTYEIRNQSEAIIDYLVEAGMGNRLLLGLTQSALTSMQDYSGAFTEDRHASDMQRDGGLSRGRVTGRLGLPSFERPIHRLDMVEQDPSTGNTYPAGTYKYYSLTEDKYKYHTDMLGASVDYLQDYSLIMERSGDLEVVTSNTLGPKVFIPEGMYSKGANLLNTEFVGAIQNFLMDPTAPKLMVSSMSRGRDHFLEKDKTNPGKHSLGMAIDLVEPDNNLSEQSITWFLNRRDQLAAQGLRLLVEVPSTEGADGELFTKLNNQYGQGTVIINGTKRHMHIERLDAPAQDASQ